MAPPASRSGAPPACSPAYSCLDNYTARRVLEEQTKPHTHPRKFGFRSWGGGGLHAQRTRGWMHRDPAQRERKSPLVASKMETPRWVLKPNATLGRVEFARTNGSGTYIPSTYGLVRRPAGRRSFCLACLHARKREVKENGHIWLVPYPFRRWFRQEM